MVSFDRRHCRSGLYLLVIGAAVLWLAASGGETPSASIVTRVAFARPAGTSLTNLGRPAIAISPTG